MEGNPALASPCCTVNCADTRYHVVRTAAASLGWCIDDDGRTEAVPAIFHGVAIAGHTLPALSSRREAEGPPRRDNCRSKHVPQILWVDRSVHPKRVAALLPSQRLNHYPGMDCIARKAALFRRLMKIRALCNGEADKRGGQAGAARAKAVAAPSPNNDASARHSLLLCLEDMYPRSFSSLSDVASLTRYMANEAPKGAFFIVKPNKGCQGRGIRVTRNPVGVLAHDETVEKTAECLIQAYVDRPLLVEGKKFDLRLYVLLTSVSPPPLARGLGLRNAVTAGTEGAATALPRDLHGVQLFIHEEGLVRMCASPYASPTDENCTDSCAHLTNYAVNKREAGYSVAPVKEATSAAEGNKRGMGFMRHFVNELAGGCSSTTEEEEPWRTVKRRIDECVVLTILSGIPVLRRELAATGAGPRSCFELLGFDIMLRGDTLSPVLMEVNHSPSLFCETDFDFCVKQQVLRDVLRVVAAHTHTDRKGIHAQPCADNQGHLRYEGVAASAAQKHSVTREEAMVRKRDVHFSQLLPHYVPCGVDVDEPAQPTVADWSEEERGRQREMVRLATTIL